MTPSLYLSAQRPAPPARTTVKIGNTLVGDGQPCFFVAEIGINHNGNPRITEFLIDAAAQARCNAVKFQKRTPDLCVPESQKSKLKETEWGEMTYIEYRRKIELTKLDYQRIDAQCAKRGIMWFASCWDIPSVEFIAQFDVPCFKVASATLTDDDLLSAVRGAGKPILLSTGMSTLQQIDHAVEVLGDHELILLHSVTGDHASRFAIERINRFQRRHDLVHRLARRKLPHWQRADRKARLQIRRAMGIFLRAPCVPKALVDVERHPKRR
jgi:sialic acid synthase SpsE